MNNILAIDASTKSTGIAYFKDDKIQYSTITSSSTSPEKRITIMRDGILQYIKENNITKVVMEEVRQDGINNRTEKLLKWLQGCIVVAIWEYDKNIKVEFIGASSWRKVLGIQKYGVKRDEYKKLDIEYANKEYNLNLTSSQDDAADAICILTAYLKDKNLVAKQPLGPIGSEKSAF
jgi:Holliday junction resolvasome RuvABC endonuclease subunit